MIWVFDHHRQSVGMVVPLGVGIGDFLAVAKLTGKIASELKEVSIANSESLISKQRQFWTALLTTHGSQNGEAASKYQDLIIELESLERALSRLYTLKPAECKLVHLEAIRAAASACKRPLESFLAKIEKFDKRLGTQNAKNSQFKGAGRRIQFNVAYEEDVKELRTTLASHVSKINLLLMTQILCVTSFQRFVNLHSSLSSSADQWTETRSPQRRPTGQTMSRT